MCHKNKMSPFALKLPWLLCILLLAAGCQWSKSGASHSMQAGDTEVQAIPVPDSTAGSAGAVCARLVTENALLRDDVKTKDLDIAKLSADLEYQKEKTRHFEQLCQNIQEDLTQAEKQFVSIEERLQLKESKASAVAALAEAKLAYDKYKFKHGEDSDAELLAEVEQKLAESGRLIEKENYAASVYYSKRANKMLERSSSTRPYLRVQGETRIVSVTTANLRNGPGLTHQIIGRLNFGTVLIQEKQSDDWLKVATEQGLQGWIHSDLIR